MTFEDRLRAAVRYFEFRDADKLPKAVPTDCAVCIEKQDFLKFNCGGEGNSDYRARIGSIEYFQCPLSLITQDAVDVINLITTSMESGIPVHGTCLLDQTRAFFDFKRVIYSEKAECFREIQKIRDSESKRKKPEQGSWRPRGAPVAQRPQPPRK